MTTHCDIRIQQVVENAIGRPLTGSELEAVNRKIDGFLKRARENGTGLDGAAKEVQEFAQKVITAQIIAKRNAALNVQRFGEMRDYLAAYDGHEDLGMDFFLLGGQRDALGSRASVGRDILSHQDRVVQALNSEFEVAGLDKLLRKARGELDEDIARAIHQLYEPEGKRSFEGIDSNAVEIAKILDRHNEMLRVEGNRHGAWTGRLQGYMSQRIHDQFRIRKDREGWLRFMDEHLDFKRSFDDVDAEEVPDLMNRIYAQLASGEHVQYRDLDAPNGFSGFGNLGRSMSYNRVLHFKTPEAEIAYIREFGPGRLMSAVFNTLRNHARDVAIMKRLGPNPEQNVEKMFNELTRKYADNAEMLSKLKALRSKFEQSYWPIMSGRANTLGDGQFAHASAVIDHTLRSANRLSLLPGLVLSQVPDVALRASLVARQGGNFFGTMFDSIEGLAAGMTDVQRREVFGDLAVAIDGTLAALTTRFDVNDPLPGMMTGMEQFMYKWNGAQGWTDRMRATMTVLDAHVMGRRVHSVAYDDLGPDYQRNLRQQGITASDWEDMKFLTLRASDDKLYIQPSKALDLTDEYVASRIDGTPTERRIADYKERLRDKLHGYFQDRASEGVLEPDLRTRAMVQGGLTGSVQRQGEGGRIFNNQFFALKAFPISIIQRILGAETLGRSSDLSLPASFAGGVRATFTDRTAMLGVAKLLAAMTLLGYVSMTLKDMAKGREPLEPFTGDPQRDAQVWGRAMAQGGALGIYGDFLIGDKWKNRYGGNVLTTFAGPGVQDAADLGNIVGEVMSGENPADSMTRFVSNNAPFVGGGPLRTAVDYLFLYEFSEALNPGYLRRTEKRLEEHMGQQHMFPPSQWVR